MAESLICVRLAWDNVDAEGKKLWLRVATERGEKLNDDEARKRFEDLDVDKWYKDLLQDRPLFFSSSPNLDMSPSKP